MLTAAYYQETGELVLQPFSLRPDTMGNKGVALTHREAPRHG